VVRYRRSKEVLTNIMFAEFNLEVDMLNVGDIGTVNCDNFEVGNTLMVDADDLKFTIKVKDAAEFKRLMPIIIDIFGSEFETSSKPSTKSLYGRIEDEVNEGVG